MDYNAEQEKVSKWIQDALTVLCKNRLSYNMGFTLEGVVKVIIDIEQTFMIRVNNTVGEVPHIIKDEITTSFTGSTAKRVRTGTCKS